MRLVLPSNSSLDIFPTNTIGTYTTNLLEGLDLPSGSWEIGLTEIQYTRSWFNVKGQWLTVKPQNESNVIKGALRDGYYKSAEDLMKELNRVTEEMGFGSDYVFTLLPSGKCSIRVTIAIVNIFDYSENLGKILGMDRDTRVIAEGADGDIIGGQTVDMNAGFYNIYVYCDLVDNTPVGDGMAPLLRIVPITGSHNEHTNYSIDHVQYIPIARRQAPTILIYLRDDFGKPILFEHGTSVVTVDLRRASPLLYT